MANLAVFASGKGSNFQAIAEALDGSQHKIGCLVCDRANAQVLDRAGRLGIPYYLVTYRDRPRSETEEGIMSILKGHSIDLIALAGYMRLLTPRLIDEFPGRILNIHPSLLPKYPGTNAIAESFHSQDSEVGITIHIVDYGMDTGPIIVQRSFTRMRDESLESMEARIHELEHRTYPEVIISLLDELEDGKRIVDQTERRRQ